MRLQRSRRSERTQGSGNRCYDGRLWPTPLSRLEKARGHRWEEGIRQHILLFRKYKGLEFVGNGPRRFAIETAHVVTHLPRKHLVALAHQHVQDRLSTHELAGG